MGYRVRLGQDQSVGQMWVIGHGLELELGQMLELEVGQMWVIGSGWVKVSLSVGQMWVIGHGLELELGQMLELEVGQMWVIRSGWVKVSSVRSWSVPTERLDMYLSGSCGSGKTRKIGEFS